MMCSFCHVYMLYDRTDRFSLELIILYALHNLTFTYTFTEIYVRALFFYVSEISSAQYSSVLSPLV